MTTIGVEEEFLLVGRASGDASPNAAAVLSRARADAPEGGPDAGVAFHAEMLSTQVEVVTPVCKSLDELRARLAEGRSRLVEAARQEGLRPVASGTAVLPSPDPPFTEDARYGRIGSTYAAVMSGYQCCGCHVHVGVPDRETGVAVVNHLRPWLPTLLALSANSPYDRGRDTGHQSWRMLEQARFPGAGVPPYFKSAAEHDREVDRLVECGVLADRTMTFWLARPSARYPTVETRAADAAITVDDAVLQAALTRALVERALDDLAQGREAPPVSDQISAAALWTAARYGMDGQAVHPLHAIRVPAGRMVTELVKTVRPFLGDDSAQVHALLDRMAVHGTGARRQRVAAKAGLPAVVTMLADDLENDVAERS